MCPCLMIVGGSVRAAAESASRAGWEIVAVDRYGDADLRRIAHTWRCFGKMQELPRLVRELPVSEWLYTGPLENHSRIIERIMHSHPLLGNCPATLRDVRQPDQLAQTLQRAGLRFPQTTNSAPPPHAGSWLMKPFRSGGGAGVLRYELNSSAKYLPVRTHYWQQYTRGRPCGAIYLAGGGQAVLLGVSEQLLGASWGAAQEFQYAGSIGPLDLTTSEQSQLAEIGNCLANEFSLQGMIGVDVICDGSDVWTIEVNPRYTASVEILERAYGIETIPWHVAACRHGELPDIPPYDQRRALTRRGKAIVYATAEYVIDHRCEETLFAFNDSLPSPQVADIPVAGTHIGVGQPIVTVFAHGPTLDAVRQTLIANINLTRELLHWYS